MSSGILAKLDKDMLSFSITKHWLSGRVMPYGFNNAKTFTSWEYLNTVKLFYLVLIPSTQHTILSWIATRSSGNPKRGQADEWYVRKEFKARSMSIIRSKELTSRFINEEPLCNLCLQSYETGEWGSIKRQRTKAGEVLYGLPWLCTFDLHVLFVKASNIK